MARRLHAPAVSRRTSLSPLAGLTAATLPRIREEVLASEDASEAGAGVGPPALAAGGLAQRETWANVSQEQEKAARASRVLLTSWEGAVLRGELS